MKKEVKILIVRTAVGLVAGVAVAAVATAAVKNMVPLSEMTKVNKAIIGFGTFIISSVVAEAGATYTTSVFDGAVQAYEIIKQNLNNSNKVIDPV